MNPNLKKYLVPGIVIAVLVLMLMSSTFVTIESGQRGVFFRKFSGGLDKENPPADQGLHVIAPWNKMIIYDTRLHEGGETMDVLTSNGLSIAIDISYRYAPIASEIAHLHDEVGQDYAAKILIPEIRSSTRKVIGKYQPEELYSSKREVIQEEIYKQTNETLHKKHINLDALLIRSIKLPKTISDAIERKLKQEQESMEYEFKIQKETKEAQRKKIEAQGIKDFQTIVSEGISDKLLKWKGIEATQEIANSQNAKIIIIGNDKGGLPVILGKD